MKCFEDGTIQSRYVATDVHNISDDVDCLINADAGRVLNNAKVQEVDNWSYLFGILESLEMIGQD
eukprot:3770365-Ditylum_brightwellii.AAC.1